MPRWSAHGRDDGVQLADAAGMYHEACRDAALPAVEVLTNLLRGTDQRHLLEHLPGHSGDGRTFLTRQVEIRDLPALGLVAHANEHVAMEVHVRRSHATDVQRIERPKPIGGAFDVRVDDDVHVRKDLEGLRRAPSSRAREPFPKRLSVDWIELRSEEEGDTAVADLRRQSHVLGTLRREHYRQVPSTRLNDR